jgi:hypothetical protein
MRTFEILGAGTVEVEQETISCDFTVSQSKFIRKYRNYLVTLPVSLIEAIKTAITKRNQKIEFNGIFHQTLIAFFKRIQLIALKSSNTAIKKESSNFPHSQFNLQLRTTLEPISKTKINHFIEKKDKGKFFPDIFLYNSKSEKSTELRPSITKILELIDKNHLKEAQIQIDLLLKRRKYLNMSKSIENRLKNCNLYINLLTRKKIAFDQYLNGDILRALEKYKQLAQDIQKFDMEIDLFKMISDEIHKDYDNMLTTKETIQLQIENQAELAQTSASLQQYSEATEILTQSRHLAEQWGFLEDIQRIEEMMVTHTHESKVYYVLQDFGQKRFPRVHLTEISAKVKIEKEIVKLYAKKLIDQKIVKATYDEENDGITFYYLQEEIDKLVQNFQDWEKSKQGKKN